MTESALTAKDWKRLDVLVTKRLAEGMRSEVMRGITPPEQFPPPADHEAEDLLLSAVLGAEVDPDALSVEPDDFTVPLARAAYGLACVLHRANARVRVEPILVALRDQGFTGPVERELLRWRDEVPSVALWHLQEKAARVHELASRRALIAQMYRIDRQLRSDAVDYQTAASDLTEWLNPPEEQGGWDG